LPCEAAGKEPFNGNKRCREDSAGDPEEVYGGEKIRIVLEGLRGEIAISELCRREGIAPTMYYRWSKAFLDAGKNSLTRDTQRDATPDYETKLVNDLVKKADDFLRKSAPGKRK
jgi:transposase